MGAQHAITIGTTTSVRVAMATNKKSDSEIRLSWDMWSYPDPTLKWDPQNPHPSSTPWSGGDNGCVKHHLAEIDIGCPKQHLAGVRYGCAKQHLARGKIWVRQTTSCWGIQVNVAAHPGVYLRNLKVLFLTSILQRHTLRRDVARRKLMEFFERDEFKKGD